MRRKERAVKSFADILAIVEHCQVIHLGMVDDGVPYVVPLNYGFSGENERLVFYLHCAKVGRKIDLLSANPSVAFELSCLAEMGGDENACSWTTYYSSVLGHGKAIFVRDDDERKRAMDLIMKHVGFKGKFEYTPQVFINTQIIKVVVEEYSGKTNAPN